MINIGLGLGLPFKARSALLPSLSLGFTNTNTLDPRITFTRASSGTHFDSTGRLVTQGYNEVLQSVLPGTGTAPTLWSAFSSGGVSAGWVTSVDNAWSFTSTAARNFIASPAVSVSASSTYTASAYVESNSGMQLQDILLLASIPAGASLSFSAGATSVPLAGTRVTCTLTVAATPGSAVFRLGAGCNANTTGSCTISRPQFEIGPTAHQYSPTTTAANSGPRFDYDPATAAGVTGGELVTNGDFSNGTTGWSSIGTGGALAVVSGELEITATAGSFPGARRSLSTETGKMYRILVTLRRGTTTSNAAVTVNGLWFGQTTTTSSTTPTTLTVFFTAQSTSTNVDLSIASGSANGTAYFDNISVQELTFTPRGLLIEEQRANLLLHSRDTTQAAWSKTDVTAARTQVGIDGVASSACLMTEGSAGTAGTNQVSTVTAGSTITNSIVMKRGNTDWVRVSANESTGTDGCNAWFNLNTGAKGVVTVFGAGTNASSTITNLGGGWYRCTVTCLPNGAYTSAQITFRSALADSSTTRVANATYTVDCAQLEVGAFATSPIITGAATATRAKDDASMTGTNFSSWFNATAGTFVVEESQPTPNNSAGILSRTDAGNMELIYGGLSIMRTRDAVPTSISTTAFTTAASGQVVKGAMGYDATGRSITAQGLAAVTGTYDLSYATIIGIYIGKNGGGSTFLNGHIRSIRYYNTRLPNATLTALTA